MSLPVVTCWDTHPESCQMAGQRSHASPPSIAGTVSHNFMGMLTERLSEMGQAVLAFASGDTRFRAIIEALPAAIYTTDAAGRITFYNEAAATMWGRRPELGELWCGSWKIYWPDGTPLPHDKCPMAVALKTGRPVRGVEAVAERPDGTRVPFEPYPTPIFDGSGTLVGAVNMLVDLTDRKRAEEGARRLASIVECSDDAIVSKDLNGVIRSWNKGAERLFGYTAAEVIGKLITILIPEDRFDEEPSILARLRRGERIEHYETIRRRKDGSLVDISLTVSPVMDADGRIIGASKIARDISDRKRAQEAQRLLLAEIMHRVKNTLATIQAIASQTLRRAPQDEQEAFRARLQALSKAHDLLTSEKWDRAPLPDIIKAALEPFALSRFTLECPDVTLAASNALHVTLAMHELATNALKYGALSNAAGGVKVTWKVLDASTLRLYWCERGGPAVARPKRKGFGTIIIERTFDRARLRYGAHGFTCTFDVRL
jgi:two-component system CheB/CheR fusion protein